MAYSGLNDTFTDAYMNLRRRAELQGRPTTQKEMAGAVEGMALSASERLARAKAAEQQDRQLYQQGEQMKLYAQDLQDQRDIAAKMMRQEKYKNIATSGLIGLGAANQMLMPAGGTGLQGLAEIPKAIAPVASGLWGTLKGVLGF